MLGELGEELRGWWIHPHRFSLTSISTGNRRKHMENTTLNPRDNDNGPNLP